jgi:hypothetical protein
MTLLAIPTVESITQGIDFGALLGRISSELESIDSRRPSRKIFPGNDLTNRDQLEL